MTSKKSTKRALLSSVVALFLCFSMLIGTTYAWFTDSVTSANNVIKTGNLDIAVEYTLDGETWNDLDGADDLFQKGLWEPGHTEVVALKIENKGSLALKYVANMNIFKEVVGKNKDGGDIVLSEILTVGTLVQEANQIGEIAVELAFKNENMYKGTTAFKASNVLEENKELLPGSAHYVIIKVDMAETVGNEANHDGVNVPSIEFGLNVLATQLAYENDSFGNDYDKDATYPDGPIIVVKTPAELTAALAKGKGNYIQVDGTLNGDEIAYPYGESYPQWNAEYYLKQTTSLSGGKLVLDNNCFDGLFVLDAGEINNMVIEGSNRNNLTIQNKKVATTIENVTVNATNGSAVTVENGTAGVTLNNLTVTQSGVGAGVPSYLECALFVSATSTVTINGGTYTSTGSAIRTGGTGVGAITVNGGTFNGSLDIDAENGDYMIVNGGTFTVDPSTVAGVTVNGTVVDNGDGTWTVNK